MPFHAKQLWLVVWLVLLPMRVHPQTVAPLPAKPDQALLTGAQLEGLVAPIALYPDPLLAEVLMASTYPLEIVQAERWLRDRKNLKEDALKAEVNKQPWENSVKSLAATPAVLEMMSSQLDWTQKLGDAVLAQQADVMAAVQRLRTKAYEGKKLTSTSEQKVSLRKENGAQHIVIEPADPDVISVPYYNPAVVYGDWPYSEYPPYYFPPPPYIPAGIITSGIAFGAGYLLGRWVSDGDRWGGGIRWGAGGIDINRPIDGNRPHVAHHWTHDRQHRGGVKYNNAAVRQRFGESPRAASRQNNAGNRAVRQGANRPHSVADGSRRKSTPRRAGSSKSAAARSKAGGGARQHVSARPRSASHARYRSVRRQPSFARAGRRHAGFGGGGRRFGGGGRGGRFRGGGRRR